MPASWSPRVWLSVVLGIFLQPFVFLYVNRPGLFWLYLVASLVCAGVDWYFGWALTLLFSLLCPLHAALIARRYDPAQPRRWYCRAWVPVGLYLLLMGLILGTRTYLYEPYSVPSASMYPGLREGDLFIAQKWGFAHRSLFGLRLPGSGHVDTARLRRGQVYVFYPPGHEVLYVKRLMALPGDIIALTPDGVVINGQTLPRTELLSGAGLHVYREDNGPQSYRIQQLDDAPPSAVRTFKVPAGHYFFLGDNRDNSNDSRYFGSVPADQIVGELIWQGSE
ncbi:signal peptidase I [Halopseudomonas pachastrellae]|uniref:signal peptidase I n=1 Tax=Halopseudomonas pachastrellae TaxID=254161 RepID=UPI0008F311AD|nr:signal peptidase I [Halopseudomonas pachastrellae]MEB3734277.1 signal peptidase I [Halopseudomonas pachastrellae]WVM91780.1 signal peptidase I [Halopseudomonas pachastrellae]SFM25346.1 signal peptidase I [Halopseudomonas pachastrellae]